MLIKLNNANSYYVLKEVADYFYLFGLLVNS